MTNPPLVSVIVRSMDRATLAPALASIGAQDYPRVEVLVVAASGASHSAQPAHCGPHPVRLVPSAVPLPRPAAANAGLDAATGDWITFLDDDDLMLPGHLSGMAAAIAGGEAPIVYHCRGRAVLADGSVQRFGHPANVMQLYERNFTQLATMLMPRSLVAGGVRFDESLPSLDDWDFILQLAQVAAFQFVSQDLVQWNAEIGTSGAGLGRNRDERAYTRDRNLIYAKWAPQRDALIDQIEPILRAASVMVQRRDYAAAEEHIRSALQRSPNNPWALNLRASVERLTGRLDAARRTQELAVVIRPHDPAMVFNLALLCRAQGAMEIAQRYCDQALLLDPDFEPAKKLRAEIPA